MARDWHPGAVPGLNEPSGLPHLGGSTTRAARSAAAVNRVVRRTLDRGGAAVLVNPDAPDPIPGTKRETAPPGTPTSPVYAKALEAQLATSRFMRQQRPFNRVQEATRLKGSLSSPSSYFDGIVAGALDHAQTFFWAPVMCSLLAQTYPTIPEYTHRAQDMSSPSGYMWFETPLPLVPGDPEVVTALLWTPIQRDDKPVYLIVPFTAYAFDPTKAERFARLLDRFTVTRAPWHGAPRRPLVWEPGEALTSWLGAAEAMYDDPAWAGEMTRVSGVPADVDKAQTLGWGRIFAAALTIVNQRLTVLAPHAPDRASRRRLGVPKAEEAPLVRAVLLRRREYAGRAPGDRDDAVPVDWACQWTVAQHWRQQWYPSEGRHKSILIYPHVKGPKDKPLKVSDPIGVVQR